MNKREVFLISLLFVVIFMGSVSASVSVGDPGYSISKSYSSGQAVTGWVNLSVVNEPFNSVIKDVNSGKSISLQGILNKQSGFGYSCVPTGCGSKYSTQGSGQNSISFQLDSGQSKTVGFLVQSQSGTAVSGVNGFRLNVTSNVGISEGPQLKIDLLNDSSTTWESYKGSGTLSGLQYACYNSAASGLSLTPLSTTGYCVEFSNIPTTPQLLLGAFVNGSGSSQISMSIYDASDLSHMGDCNATATGTGNVSCIPKNEMGIGNFSISKQGNFYVCISYPAGSSGNYKINSTTSFSCGFAGSPPPQSGQAKAGFQIFAKWEKFAPIGSFILNDTSIQESGNLGYNSSTNISDYIQNNYQNDCSSGCVIPITFYSNKTQNITLSGFNLNYAFGGLPQSTSSLYDTLPTPASFSTRGYQKLSLDGANFTTSNSVGNHSFNLIFNDGTYQYSIISTNYSILNVPKSISISPLVVAALNPTEFNAVVISPEGGAANITSYKWDFGDGSAVQTTTSDKVSHKYSSVGVFNMTVNVTNSVGLSSLRKVQIVVLAPKEAVNQVLSQKLDTLKRLRSEINNVTSDFSRNALTNVLNINQTGIILDNITSANASAGASEAQYVGMLEQLNSIDLPASIQETQKANSVPFVPTKSSINLDALQAIGGGNYTSSQSDNYKNALLSWDVKNIQAKVNYHEFSTVTGNNSQQLLDVVSLSVSSNPSGGNAYLIIPKMDGMTLDKNYPSSGNYYYVTLGNTPQTVEFATTQSLSPVSLPVFIAPSLDQISVSGGNQTGNNDNTSKWLILAGILGGVFLIAFIVYIILGKWYQNRYESYLFKNKNDLYNVVNYIHSAKTRGVKNSDIEKSLRRSSWTSEQISYVMKKYLGKGVGLPGFVKRMRDVRRRH